MSRSLGIGLGIAGALAAAGFDLVLLDRAWDAADKVALGPLRDAGARIRLIGLDLADIDRHEGGPTKSRPRSACLIAR